MAFDYDDCIKRNLLRKIPPSKEKASRSLQRAEQWLQETHNTIQSKAFNASVLTSYNAMFHSARAILFADGFREKSHACIARYLEEKYVKSDKLEKKWVELLDYHRQLRHNEQYDLSFFSTESDAEKAMESARQFVARMQELFEQSEKSQ